VTEASNLYNEGKYDESYEPWQAVLKYDGNYRRAYIGIGNALFNRGEYKEAMKYFKISISRGRYNKAFEGYRDQWLKQNFTLIVIVLIVIIVAYMVTKKILKKRKQNSSGKGGA
ncbi:MAG: tetratricopeptide repeat protein, partial [Oscillospiraceae bacterium]